jgi:ABC-type multidrug transport system ATPase subunit
LGHNGAGKSIIMGMLMGFLRPDSGLMTVRNPCFWPNGVVRRGVCMQKDVLYQELTV